MNIFFLSTRISGNDGVSLEAVRWRDILTRAGHKVTFVAGELDRAGLLIPELHFQWPEVVRLHDKVLYEKNNYKKVEREIFELAGKIEGKLRELFNGGGKIDLLIVANVLSLPMHFPLAVALTRVIGEYGFPTIARHHDFWWERKRFLCSSMFPFFEKWFPPNLPNLRHVVINSIAQKELKKRFNLPSAIIPDTFDFESDLNKIDSYSKKFREDFRISTNDLIFLQATRIVPRKRIELSIELIKKLNDPRSVLVVTGKDEDEAGRYEHKIRKLAKDSGVKALFIGNFVNSKRKIKASGRRVYKLWDAFINSDFITYPTMLEGFGNQFIETVYFKKPIIVTPYEVYKKDIRPLGFEVVEMPDKVTDKVLDRVRDLIEDKNKVAEMVEKNFEIGRRNFSYETTKDKIDKIIKDF